MKLGLNLGYWQRHADDATESVLTAERLGYDSVWTAEAYGTDAFTPLAWYGARTKRIKLGTSVAQISARPPVTTAMTAMTLDHLTGGRLLLGIGASGPQVVEGWYGQPFARPLARTREYVEIMRKVWRREEPVTSDGPHYPLPLPGGLGKPLKLITTRAAPASRSTWGRRARRTSPWPPRSARAGSRSSRSRPRSRRCTGTRSPRVTRASTSRRWSWWSSPTTSGPRSTGSS